MWNKIIYLHKNKGHNKFNSFNIIKLKLLIMAAANFFMLSIVWHGIITKHTKWNWNKNMLRVLKGSETNIIYTKTKTAAKKRIYKKPA